MCHHPIITQLRLDSKTLALLDLIPSWLAWAEIECTVHVGLLKGRGAINWFWTARQSRQQVLDTHCPNIYTVYSELDIAYILWNILKNSHYSLLVTIILFLRLLDIMFRYGLLKLVIIFIKYWFFQHQGLISMIVTGFKPEFSEQYED